MSRISDVTDHTGAITRYNYDLRGGMTKVTADYGTANAKETAYVLNANGATTKQTLPSAHYNEFSYDDGGRVTNQVLFDSRKKEVETYAYNYAPSGLPSFTYGYTRTEKNGDVYTFVNDRMGRLKQEKKVNSGAVTQYQQDFTYDKNGNRLSMQQTGSGSGISSYTYTYTYDAQGKLTYIKDVARYYTGTITTDANGNITSVNEAWTGTANTWKTDFTFDYENRLTKTQISGTAGGKTVKFQSISHAYDGLNRLIKTTYGNSYGHVFDGNNLLGNTNLATSTDGTPNVYAMHNAKPLAGTQINSSTTTRYYNVADERTSLRSSFTDTGTSGDTAQQTRYGEYKVIDSTSIAYNFYGPVGTKQSELFRLRTVSITENTVALPSEQGNLEVGGVNITFEGTRVKSALVGRDLNPIGRGDGVYYYAGAMALGVAPATPGGSGRGIGTGNSVNNCGQMGMMAKPEDTRNFDFLSILMMMASIGILNQLYSLMFASLGFGGNNTDILPNIPPKPDFIGESPIDKSKVMGGGGGVGSEADSPCNKNKPPTNLPPQLRAVGCCTNKPCCVDKNGKPLSVTCDLVDELCCKALPDWCGWTKDGTEAKGIGCCNKGNSGSGGNTEMPDGKSSFKGKSNQASSGNTGASSSCCSACNGGILASNAYNQSIKDLKFDRNMSIVFMVLLGIAAVAVFILGKGSPGSIGIGIGAALFAVNQYQNASKLNNQIATDCNRYIGQLTNNYQNKNCDITIACKCLPACKGTLICP